MSELREEILGAGINKKKVIGILLIAVLLISVFAYSVLFFSYLFGSQRPSPNEEYHDEYEDVLKVMPPLPLDILSELMEYFLANPEDLLDFMDALDLEDLADLEDFAGDFSDVIEDMIDADIDDFDISDFSQALLPLLGAAGALLLSEKEVFRVYDYDSLIDMQDVLWKYESFDEYNESEWLSNAATEVIDFVPLSDYYSQYSTLDLLQLKMEISPNAGPTSMVLPSLFPYPYVMEDSMSATNLVPDSPILNKDEFNCSLIGLDFSSADSVNLTFELFGKNLPTEQEISSSAVLVTNPSAEYSSLRNQFTQLPPTVTDYINSHPYFKNHYDALDLIINSNDNDYEIATKIKNYLQTNFIFSWDAVMNDPAGDTEDIVEWFSEHEEGLYAEFTSAFCVFARTFGVANRFVDGYRSVSMGQIDEIYDSQEGKDAILIKYKHLYNWAEVFIPTDITGNGYWIQFDIEPESASQGQFTLTLNSNFSAGFRGGVANLTATLSSPESSVVNRTIKFTDLTSGGTTIGQVLTDPNGQASILVNINNSQVVGPHPILASFSNLASDSTYYVVYGDIEVNLLSVNPTLVNRSISNSTTIQGYVMDPIANQRVENATIELVLLDLGTNNKIANPFDTIYTDTDSNGNFNEMVNVDPSVIRGVYEIRVDFNGSWNGVDLTFGAMSNSSDRIEFNVTGDFTYRVLFSINGTPTEYPFGPNIDNIEVVKRFQLLNFSVTLLDDVSKTPVSGENVEFYDYTNGNVFIGSNITDSSGNAWITYYIGPSNKSGPTLVYAQCDRYSNYSYYIVNESIGIDVISPVNPYNIDIAFFPYPTFNVQCELIDIFDNTIDYSQIDVKMNNSVGDTTSYLTTPHDVNPTPLSTNFFNFDRTVNFGTPIDNYTIKIEFNGNFNFSSYPYSTTFNLGYLYNSTDIQRQLRVFDSSNVLVYLVVDGNSTRSIYNDAYKPGRYKPGEFVNFTVWVNQSDNYAPPGSIVRIKDAYTNTVLDSITFALIDNGYHEFIIDSNNPPLSAVPLHSGLHYIEVEYEYNSIANIYNSTYIIINGTVNTGPVASTDYVIKRNSGSFTVSGTVTNGTYLKGLQVEIILLDKNSNDVSSYLNLIDPNMKVINDADGTYSFTNQISLTCPQGVYNVSIKLTGRIQHTDGLLSINVLNPYMISSNNSLLQLDINAGTVIIQDGYHSVLEDDAPTEWINGDTLYVYGNLTWDNGTEITDMIINVTIWYDGNVIAFNDIVQTDSVTGEFNVSLVVDLNWPRYRSDTAIFVEFDSIYNGFSYVEDYIIEFV